MGITYEIITQMNLTNLEIFSEVCRIGNFSAVARQRNISPSAVSRAVAALEAELGVLLFYRTTRKISPTEAAVMLANQVDTHLEALHSIRTNISDTREKANGVLRVSASHSFGIVKLGPIIPEFRAKYPDIKVDLALTDRIVDIVGERFDVAIRHGPMPDSSFVAKTILRTKYYACASPTYLEKITSPIKEVLDIADLHCLTFPLPGFANIWRFRNSKGQETEVPIRGVMSVNSGIVLRESALRGDGIVLLSDWIVGDDLESGKLVDLFPSMTATPSNYQTGISAVYPHRKHTPKKVSVFIEFLQRKMRLNN
jgi:DNA-binding transcriptional LysR family regulator